MWYVSEYCDFSVNLTEVRMISVISHNGQYALKIIFEDREEAISPPKSYEIVKKDFKEISEKIKTLQKVVEK